jgi:hypothetical protein
MRWGLRNDLTYSCTKTVLLGDISKAKETKV